jgi:predicted ATPase
MVESARKGGLAVLVHGEAGIGKTALVETFLDNVNGAARVFRGACDALFTPRPLGPLYDLASQASPGLRKLIFEEFDRARAFPAFLDEFSGRDGPVVVLLEDMHWADEAARCGRH